MSADWISEYARTPNYNSTPGKIPSQFNETLLQFNDWTRARTPNYVTNVDKFYPYSEVPYIGQYNLVKIPVNESIIQLLDYWGEGRIDSSSGISGFPDCYNVNHQHQCVTNGPDVNRKIPNRVPVENYTTCDTSAYIKDSSVLTVTVMGTPISNSCSKVIARIVHKTDGAVVVFGLGKNSAHIRNLEGELYKYNFINCPHYELPPTLTGLTLFDLLSDPEKLKTELKTSIDSKNYDAAVNLSKSLSFSSYDNVLRNVITGLLQEGNKNMLSFAYKLWNGDAEKVVNKYFPPEFKLIFDERLVALVNKKNGYAMKLSHGRDSNNDREAYGDSSDRTSERVCWKFMPSWRNDRVVFRILNIDKGMYLKLSVSQDSNNDRAAFGDIDCPDNRRYWYLDPLLSQNEMLFFIMNLEYDMGLKLDANTDGDRDRRVWGHGAGVHHSPGYFGWFIQRWN